MEYTPPPSYNSVDLEAQLKDPKDDWDESACDECAEAYRNRGETDEVDEDDYEEEKVDEEARRHACGHAGRKARRHAGTRMGAHEDPETETETDRCTGACTDACVGAATCASRVHCTRDMGQDPNSRHSTYMSVLEENPTGTSCMLWISTCVLSGMFIHYDLTGSMTALAATVPILLFLFYVVFQVNNTIKEDIQWPWSCLSYLPLLQLFLAALVFFSDRGLVHWFTISVFSGVLMIAILVYCSWQSLEDWEEDCHWEEKNKMLVYWAPLMTISALQIINMVSIQYISMVYFIYLSVLLSLTTKRIYLSGDLEEVLWNNIKINGIMFLMFLSWSNI